MAESRVEQESVSTLIIPSWYYFYLEVARLLTFERGSLGQEREVTLMAGRG